MSSAKPSITLVRASDADVETLHVGPITIKILEDGRNTADRLGSMVLTIAPKTPGPMLHWHRMHDETFLVTKGKIRFHTGDAGDVDVDAGVGDYVIVPVKAVHSFSNPFDEEAEFFNTFTPCYYIDYLRMLERAAKKAASEGKKGPLSDQIQKEVMGQFATFAPGDEGIVDF